MIPDDDPKPTQYPDQGPYKRAGGWLMFTIFVGNGAASGGLALLVSSPPRVAIACLLLSIFPVGAICTVRSYIIAVRSTDVYASTADGVRTDAELQAWKARQAARDAAAEDGNSNSFDHLRDR